MEDLHEYFASGRRVKVVIDTDAYNEIDDQFALVYALLSPDRMDVQAIHAAPFENYRVGSYAEGMEKSYQEILRVTGLLGLSGEGRVFRGATHRIGDREDSCSDASADLIRRARLMPEGNKLVVIAIGAITNIAAALAEAPEISARIVVLWLGGHPSHWPHNHEFNLKGDPAAVRILLDSEVPLVRFPCATVAEALTTTLSELSLHLQGCGEVGDYLLGIFANYDRKGEDLRKLAASKTIWDLAPFAWAIEPHWFEMRETSRPRLLDDLGWGDGTKDGRWLEAMRLQRDPVFRDFFIKLRGFKEGRIVPRLAGPDLAESVQDSGATGALQLIESRKPIWLEKASSCLPVLNRTPLDPLNVAGQLNEALQTGDELLVDFGRHLTGYLAIDLRQIDTAIDAPVRLQFTFGETLAEATSSFDDYSGTLCKSWLQQDVFTFDVVPATVQLPRRYAFRYVRIRAEAVSRFSKVGIASVSAVAVTSADDNKVPPFDFQDEKDALLDAIARSTLRDCMMTVLEDGPKRDRRLWLGDLRLQALANYCTFANHEIVRRCLYLIAALADTCGLVATSVHEHPKPARGKAAILDYSALFSTTVLEYVRATGDRETADDIWPLVLHQLSFTLRELDEKGLFQTTDEWWLFVDWNKELDKQAALHATILYGLKDTLALAELLGRQKDVFELEPLVCKMKEAAMKHLWDPSLECFVSGPNRQISWMSQAWMVLAGVPSVEEGRVALIKVFNDPQAIRTVSPYGCHYMTEALWRSGLEEEARSLLSQIWYGMAARGADTFWEVFVPGDPDASPYDDPLANSACHAWSCTPSWFLRVLFPGKFPS